MKKKNKKLSLSLIFIIAFVLIVCIILVVTIFKTNSKGSFKVNHYDKDGIKFDYDNTFKLSKKKDHIELVTKDGSAVVAIKKQDYSYDLDDDKAESISYQITLEDGNYSLIYSDYKNDKYYFLYENYDLGKQIEIVELQKGDYLYLIVFEAKSDEFDLYQESFNIIVSTFKV